MDNNTLTLFTCCFLLIVNLQSQSLQKAVFSGKTEVDKISVIKLGGEPIALDEKGRFYHELDIDYPTILSLQVVGDNYEIFLHPGKTVQLSIQDSNLVFTGDLAIPNAHLVKDKKINDEVSQYLGKNWYSLHSKSDSAYVAIIDSLKGLFLTNLESLQSGQATMLQTFKQLNTASVEYAFNRMILRYPDWHKRFTGNAIELNSATLKKINMSMDEPQFSALEAYKKYVRTWFDLKIQEQLSNTKDTTTYLGYQRLKKALALVSDQFKRKELKDFWTLEFIKGHTDQYTWINGSSFIQDFRTNCTTPNICKALDAYETELLTKRNDHEIQIYKTVQGLHLEAHIFRPDNFDDSKKYPALAAFHGGGWIAGHASWTFGSARHAAENGLIGVAIEYRLSNRSDITPIEAMEDTRDAIRWLRQHADSLNIDPDKIVGKGLSAGGHLINAISVLPDTASNTQFSSIPNVLVLVSPAIDTQDDYFKSLLLGRVNPGTLSPLENLKEGQNMPKTLILQGRTDRLTPTKYAEAFKSKMDTFNYECQLKIYEGCGHLFTPSHLDDTGWPQSDPEIVKLANQEQVRFLKELGYISAKD